METLTFSLLQAFDKNLIMLTHFFFAFFSVFRPTVFFLGISIKFCSTNSQLSGLLLHFFAVSNIVDEDHYLKYHHDFVHSVSVGSAKDDFNRKLLHSKRLNETGLSVEASFSFPVRIQNFEQFISIEEGGGDDKSKYGLRLFSNNQIIIISTTQKKIKRKAFKSWRQTFPLQLSHTNTEWKLFTVFNNKI